MDKMFITNQMGERLEVGVVRFFEHNEITFLIYTLSEVDANNYVKLYVTKVNTENVQSITITEESEWNSFKDVMKEIIRNNKNNLPLQIKDLDPQEINNIVIYDSKVFKLSSEMVSFLQMNKKVSNNVAEVGVNESVSVPNVFNMEQQVAPIVQEPISAPIAPEPISIPEASNNEVGVGIPNIPSDIMANNQNVIEQPQETTVQPELTVTPVVPEMPSTAAISEIPQDNMVMPPVEEVNTIDYEKAYLEEQQEVNGLIQKVADLENEINNLNAKLEQIKNIIG